MDGSGMSVSAVVVTRGDVDLWPCLKPILAAGIQEIILRVGVAGVAERYDGARAATNEIIYTQDDDCAVDVAAVLAAYEYAVVACNMPEWKRPEYPAADGIALVGWGAVFHKCCVPDRMPVDALARREADRLFTGLNRLKLIDVPFEHLPWAHGADRLGRQPEHAASLQEIRRRIQVLRDEG
jgi:hypothetical protein